MSIFRWYSQSKTLARNRVDCQARRRTKSIRILKRLKDILDIVVVDEHATFRTIIADMKRDQKIFEQLRNALKICPKGGTQRRNDEGASNLLSSSRHQAVLTELRESLERKARRGSPSEKACNIVVLHLDKYWDYLFGHVLKKRPEKIVVPRTNNVEESLFRTIKRQCRRLHGRGHVCRDIDDMSEAAPLVLNLRNPSYCEIVYGGTTFQSIAERFSTVDPIEPAQLLKDWRRDKISVRLPRKFERLTSLPRCLAPFIGVAFRELQE